MTPETQEASGGRTGSLVVAATWGVPGVFHLLHRGHVRVQLLFLEAVGTLTIADPQNWVALFSFLTTALIGSRLSDKAKRRALVDHRAAWVPRTIRSHAMAFRKTRE